MVGGQETALREAAERVRKIALNGGNAEIRAIALLTTTVMTEYSRIAAEVKAIRRKLREMEKAGLDDG